MFNISVLSITTLFHVDTQNMFQDLTSRDTYLILS